MILATKPTFRNPFKITSSTFLVNAYRRMYDSSSLITQEIIGRSSLSHTLKKGAFKLFWVLYPFKSFGEFTIEKQNNNSVSVGFNAKNTQFHALYLTRYQNGYEPEVTNFIDAVLPDDGVFYDIGANWGYFSFFCATKPNFYGKIFAFEPFLPAFKDFKRIIASAGLEHVIIPFNLAVSQHAGNGAMKLPDGMHSGLAMLAKEGPSLKTHIQVISLDSFFPKLQPPTIIKIDAEGSETDILRGASNVIALHRPMIIFENWTDIHKPKESLEPHSFLSEKDYLFFHPVWMVDDSMVPGNRALFMPGKKMLILKQFFSAERLLFSQKINCIACPREKATEYLKNFQEVTLS